MIRNDKEHPVHKLIQKARKIFLSFGFKEVENPIFIPEGDIYKQYGREAPAILDRIYYIAELPRPDIGLGKQEIAEIKKTATNIDIEELKKTMREYRRGDITGEILSENLVKRLKISVNEAIKLIDLFSELKNLIPEPTKITLRSHMTAGWFPTIEVMQYKLPMPLKLFSVGIRFRREQKVDASHLRAHYGASCVIVGKDVNLKAGKEFTKKLFENLGLKNISFVKKDVTSNYYEEGTEYECFSNNVEIANLGMYSRRALENYNTRYAVFNLGFGLERVLMVIHGYSDAREVIYPQFYGKWELTDKELANTLYFSKKPKTKIGMRVAISLIKTCIAHGSVLGPCKILAWKGTYKNKKISVFLVKDERNEKLCGDAILNEIIVKNGNVYGLPKTGEFKGYFKGCVNTGIRYMDSFAQLVGAEMEEKNNTFQIEIKMVKKLGDINLRIQEHAHRYIMSANKKIDVKGPMFIKVVAIAKDKDK